jgi:hypothetical protein
MGENKFNYNRVLFTLSTISTPEDKISYLYKVKVDVNRVIQCFTRSKFQSLKKYAKKNIFAEDGCDELTEFLQKVISYYNSPLYGERYISDEILKRHLKEEVIKYQNFLKIIDSDIEYWISKREDKNYSENKNVGKMEKLKETETGLIDDHLIQSENSTSIRELLQNKQKRITWRGSKEDLIYFFDQLFGQQLLKIKSYDEIFSLVSHYFVDEKGEAIIVEKSASAKMNLHGPKIPEGYQRYMKSIEKLKSNNQ